MAITAPWLNWIEQPPPKGQVAGSNPAGVATFVAVACEHRPDQQPLRERRLPNLCVDVFTRLITLL